MDLGKKIFVGEGHEVSWLPRKKVSPQLYPKKHKNRKKNPPYLKITKRSTKNWNALKSWRQGVSKGKGIVQFSKKYQNNIVAYILWGGGLSAKKCSEKIPYFICSHFFKNQILLPFAFFLIFFYVKSIFGTLLLDFEGY